VALVLDDGQHDARVERIIQRNLLHGLCAGRGAVAHQVLGIGGQVAVLPVDIPRDVEINAGLRIRDFAIRNGLLAGGKLIGQVVGGQQQRTGLEQFCRPGQVHV
jgi:hypothetical protein